jgi:hypothetical protein
MLLLTCLKSWCIAAFLWLCAFTGIFAQNGVLTVDSLPAHDSLSGGRMGFFDLNIGPDYRQAHGIYDNTTTAVHYPYHATAVGWTGRMQSSFLGNFILSDRKGKLKIGDVLAAEASLGGLTTGNPNEKSGIWLAYRVEFGGALIWHANKNNDAGITFTLLKFSRDKVSPNVSGSGITFRYRYRKFQAEAALEVRRERIAGYLMPHVPLQFAGTLRYLLNKRNNLGVRFESLSGNRNTLFTDNLQVQRIWSLKLFYGIYF